jgi:hypothetical protein
MANEPDDGEAEAARGLLGFLRRWLLKIWISHGAGYYGLGFLLTFLSFEIQLLVDDLVEADGVSDFVTEQAFELILRFGFESFINGFKALIWPLYVIDGFGGWGIALLVVGYLAFERVARPIVEQTLPELKQARLAAEQRKAQEED